MKKKKYIYICLYIMNLNRVFHYFHHPFWGFPPYFWFNTHIYNPNPKPIICNLFLAFLLDPWDSHSMHGTWGYYLRLPKPRVGRIPSNNVGPKSQQNRTVETHQPKNHSKHPLSISRRTIEQLETKPLADLPLY